MTEETKPRYELKRRSKNFVGLWDGDRCLCAICTRKTRGVGLLDAQLILLAMNSHKDLLEACKLMVDSHGMHGPCEHHCCQQCKTAYTKAKAAIANAKPK